MMVVSSSTIDKGIKTPSDNDVLLGRGAACWNHPGNRAFRDIVQKYLTAYENATLRIDKSNIVSNIFDKIHANNGRFLKLDHAKKTWYSVEQRQAIEKIGHAIRDKRAIMSKLEQQAAEDEHAARELQEERDSPALDLGRHHPANIMRGLTREQQDSILAFQQESINFPGPSISALLARHSRITPPLRSQNPPLRQLPSSLVPPLQRRLQNNNPMALRRSFFAAPPVPPAPSANSTSINGGPNDLVMQQLNYRRGVLLEEATRSLRTASEALQNLQDTQDALNALAGQRRRQQNQQQQQQQLLPPGLSTTSNFPSLPRATSQSFPPTTEPTDPSLTATDATGNSSLMAFAYLSTLVERLEKITTNANLTAAAE